MTGKNVQMQICRTDDLSDDIRNKLFSSPDHVCITDESFYLLFDQTVICIPDGPGRNDLISVLTKKNYDMMNRPENASGVFTRILNDPDYHPDPSTLRLYRIRENRNRVILVFRAYSPLQDNLCTLLSAMAPVDDVDSIIPADYQTAVFVKDSEGQSEEEMKEFTEAVIGTLETEGITEIKAGIGRERNGIHDLRNSYLEAVRALDIGVRFHRNENVFAYADLTLERIVDSIPAEQKKEILQTFYGAGSEKRLSDEMVETVRVFFRNDLNLTAASKQLYIHRNTLNYRLDKIKKDFGLDLRSFSDAVVFRIITEIFNES